MPGVGCRVYEAEAEMVPAAAKLLPRQHGSPVGKATQGGGPTGPGRGWGRHKEQRHHPERKGEGARPEHWPRFHDKASETPWEV